MRASITVILPWPSSAFILSTVTLNLHYTCKIKALRCSVSMWKTFFLFNQTHKDFCFLVAVVLCVVRLRDATSFEHMFANTPWHHSDIVTWNPPKNGRSHIFLVIECVGVQMTTTCSQPRLRRTLQRGAEIAHASLGDWRLIVCTCVTEQQLLMLHQKYGFLCNQPRFFPNEWPSVSYNYVLPL